MRLPHRAPPPTAEPPPLWQPASHKRRQIDSFRGSERWHTRCTPRGRRSRWPRPFRSIRTHTGVIMEKKVIGIDLGTTNFVVDVMEGGDPVVIANSGGGRTV